MWQSCVEIAIKIHLKSSYQFTLMAIVYAHTHVAEANIYYNVLVSVDNYSRTIVIDGVETSLGIWYVYIVASYM